MKALGFRVYSIFKFCNWNLRDAKGSNHSIVEAKQSRHDSQVRLLNNYAHTQVMVNS
jgi:predicted ATP-grasp superfamily ATP-dependent carboligase